MAHKSIWFAFALVFTVAGASSCSIEPLPISSQRVESARKAREKIARGPGAPGYFEKAWAMDPQGSGYAFDPGLIEMSGGVARLKKLQDGSYSRAQPTLEITTGRPFVALDGFSDIAGPKNQGTLKYQLSNDGVRWFYFDGKKAQWAQAASRNAVQASTGAEIAAHIPNFHETAGMGSFYLRVFLISTGKEPVELSTVKIAGISPKADSD